EAQAAMKLLSDERSSATHPGRNYRLAAISKGWQNADAQVIASTNGYSRESQQAQQQPEQVQREQVQPARQHTRAAAATQNMDSRLVLRKVVFSSAPNEQFFLTTRL